MCQAAQCPDTTMHLDTACGVRSVVLFCGFLAGSARRLCSPLLPRRSSRNAFGDVTTEGDVFLPWFASGAWGGTAGAGYLRSVGNRRAEVHYRALRYSMATGDTRLVSTVTAPSRRPKRMVSSTCCDVVVLSQRMPNFVDISSRSNLHCGFAADYVQCRQCQHRENDP